MKRQMIWFSLSVKENYMRPLHYAQITNKMKKIGKNIAN